VYIHIIRIIFKSEQFTEVGFMKLSNLFFLKILVISIALGLSGQSLAQEASLGSSRLHPHVGSGVQGRILYLDSGNADDGLVVSGSATGLDPNEGYVTLLYDPSTVPGGPTACKGFPVTAGFWGVDPDGNGSLFAILTGSSYIPLSAIGTNSIRMLLNAPPFPLQACGRTRSHGP